MNRLSGPTSIFAGGGEFEGIVPLVWVFRLMMSLLLSFEPSSFSFFMVSVFHPYGINLVDDLWHVHII